MSFVFLTRVNKKGNGTIYSRYVPEEQIFSVEDIAGVPQAHGATVANARVILLTNLSGQNGGQNNVWEVTQTVAEITGAGGVTADAPLTGTGTTADPLDIDFSALEAADLAAICAAITGDSACLQALFAAMAADVATALLMDAYWDSRMQTRFQLAGTTLSIDLDADGAFPAC
jgi:hypothetical protein